MTKLEDRIATLESAVELMADRHIGTMIVLDAIIGHLAEVSPDRTRALLQILSERGMAAQKPGEFGAGTVEVLLAFARLADDRLASG